MPRPYSHVALASPSAHYDATNTILIVVLVQEGRLWLGVPEYGLCVPAIPQTALSYHILRIAMQQHCNIRGYIPHGHNPNISLNHKWKYYRGKSHYVLDPQN